MLETLKATVIVALLALAGLVSGSCTRGLELGLGEADAADTGPGGDTESDLPDGGDTDSDDGDEDGGPDGAIGDGGAD